MGWVRTVEKLLQVSRGSGAASVIVNNDTPNAVLILIGDILASFLFRV